MTEHEHYMHRCLQLAQLGAGHVAPNPMVGSVLVYQHTIIGEGYHQQYGQAHAEVNCINSVAPAHQHLIEASTLYVSLEPCAHFGKTPPCADLIVAKQIPKVVIGCRDSFAKVDGKGIQKLQQAGIDITVGVLEDACIALNKRFFHFHQQKSPFVLLKWAQTKDGFIAPLQPSTRLLISNAYSNRLVHQWRSQESAILVGTQTALLDNPALTNRYWSGKSPIRLVIDKQLQLPTSLHLFDQQVPTIVFNCKKQMQAKNVLYYQLPNINDFLAHLLQACYQLNIQSILVEGGQQLLSSFIQQQLWQEARIITNQQLQIGAGLAAPNLQGQIKKTQQLFNDTIHYLEP